MDISLDIEGLQRVAALHLRRCQPANRRDAMTLLERNLRAYDVDGEALRAGVDAYFSGQ